MCRLKKLDGWSDLAEHALLQDLGYAAISPDAQIVNV